MNLTVVTCTGGRPELFSLCRKWVLSQVMCPTRWIVTTDFGDSPHAPEAEVFKIPKGLMPDVRPATRALAYALGQVDDGSDVVVMEDDDWYGPEYISTLMGTGKSVAHQSKVSMFHLPTSRYRDDDYDSPVEGTLFFRAGMKPAALNWLLKWTKKDRKPFPSFPVEMNQVVQIKGVGYGLPGRPGQTIKHITENKKVKEMLPDDGHKKFRWLLGRDADDYLKLLGGK